MSLKKWFVRLNLALLALLCALAPLRAADEMKPVAVLSFAGYDALVDSAGVLADTLGHKETLDAMLTMAGSMEGIDKSKPAGAVLLSDGTEIFAFGFLPITDLEALDCPGIEDLKNQYDKETGLLTLSGEGDGAVRVKLTQRDGWCFITGEGKESLLPAEDTLSLLDGLNEKYLVGGKLYADRIPADLLDTLLAPLRQQMAELEPSQSDSVEYAVKALVNQIESLESVECGLSVDAASGDLVLTCESVAKPGSDIAEIFEKAKSAETRWSDFNRPEDSVYAQGHVNFMTKKVADLMLENYQNSFKQFAEDLDTALENEKDAEAIKKVIEHFESFLDQNIALEEKDFAASLTAEPILMIGGTIAAGDKLTETLAELNAYFASTDENDGVREFLKNIKINGSDFAGYKVSTATLSQELSDQLAAADPDLAGMIPAVLLGVKNDAIILLAGLDKKKVSEQFKSLAQTDRKPQPVKRPMTFQLSLKNIGVLLGNLLPNAEGEFAKLIQTLKEGPDDAVISAFNESDGLKVTGRLVVRGKFLKLAGDAFHALSDSKESSDTESGDDLFDQSDDSL